MLTAIMSEPTESPLLITQDGPVVTWTLNLPEQRNPITGEDMVAALVAAAHGANGDPTVRAIVLTGAGSAFCAGGNVKDMAERRGYFGAAPYDTAQGYRSGIQAVTRAVYACDVPIVAAVNGPAVGAGCDLAMLCDIRIASVHAIFAESFVNLGLIPGDGGAWLLPRVVGHARASHMALTGERVDAYRALEWGLVSEVVKPEALMPTAYDIARQIAANPPQAVRMTKRLLRESRSQSLEQTLEVSAFMQAVAHQAEDHQTAVANLLDRDNPPRPYSGR